MLMNHKETLIKGANNQSDVFFLCISVRRENLLRLDQRHNLQKRSEIFKFLTHLTPNLHG